jgi:hypothetical protein
MKEIVLKPVEIYENHMLIDVYDYTYPIYEKHSATLAPNPSMKKGKPKLRKRMTIDVDYSAYDISGIRGDCPTLDEALEYYKGYIYNLVRVRILDDWYSESCLEVLDIIRQKIAKYYE